MRFEHDKMVLWYGTADASAPSGPIPATAHNQAVVTITAAVQPRSAENAVQVIYRVNGGKLRTLPARSRAHDLVNKIQHFLVTLPPFEVDDQVDYVVVARSPSGQTPSPAEAANLSSSFRIVPGSQPSPANTSGGSPNTATSEAPGPTQDIGTTQSTPLTADTSSSTASASPASASSSASEPPATGASPDNGSSASTSTVSGGATDAQNEVANSRAASGDATHQAVASLLQKSPDAGHARKKAEPHSVELPANAVKDQLKATQRLMRVTTDADAIQVLLKLGFDSAFKIAATPRGAFLDQHAEALGGKEKAAQIHANATSISALTSHIVLHAQENAAAGMPRMIASGGGDAEKTLDGKIPNWQTLFGASSTCQCAECRAVDGPAAYFVSLLQFLDGIGKHTAHPPLDVLLKRRPDLVNLKLTCANCDTPLPYVDLVNEILECYVAHGQVQAGAAHDTPSDATPAALSVNPEYLQTPDAIKAYEILNDSSAVYPFTLPFDRYLETARNYLRFLGVSRYDLLKEFALPRTAHDSGSVPLAAEYLGLSEAEYILITNQDFSGKPAPPKNVLYKYFGYSSGDAAWHKKSLIEQVPEFLSRTNLVYTELLDLLETQYLNPQGTIGLELRQGADPCDITAMRIENVGDLLPPLPAFLRLRKKLGWKTSELDYALRAFSVTPGVVKGDNPRPIPAGFLLVAAQLKQLQETLNLSITQTVSLWQDLDTSGRGSHYNSLFQNKLVSNPPDPGLALLYQAPLTAPPHALPERWSDGSTQNLPVEEASTSQLQFTGTMTDAQRDDLFRWAGNSQDAVAAVQTLFDQRWYDGIAIAGLPAAAANPPSNSPAALRVPSIVLSPKSLSLASTEASSAPTPDSIANHLHAILAALRISFSDLVAIGQDAGLCDPQTAVWAPATLTLGNLSMLNRYALLARALGLSVTDLITLENLSGLEPFHAGALSLNATAKSSTAPGIVTTKPIATNAFAVPLTDAMVEFVLAAHQVRDSQFSIPQLAYLFGADSGLTSGVAPLQSDLDTVISTILVGLQNIAAANAFAPDPTGAALRKKLATVLPSTTQVNAVMNLIAGNTIFMTPLAALPGGVVLSPGQVSFVTAATIAGAVTALDSITLSVNTRAIAASPIAVSYTVQPPDTLSTIAAGLAAQINNNAALVAAGISATVSGPVIGLSVPAALNPPPVWTASQNPTGATETVSLDGSLFCAGPMTGATAAALSTLTNDAGFNGAIRDLYNQAQSLLIQNLGVPAYFAALPAVPAGVTLPPGQVSLINTVTIGGPITAQDSLSLTMTSSSVTGSPVTVSYAVQSNDTPITIAAALASQINGNSTLVTAGISAFAFGPAIGFSAPSGLKPAPVWAASTSPSATETVTMGAGLVCYGAMSKPVKAALLAKSQDAGFTAAVGTLYEQAHAADQVIGSVIANLIYKLPVSAPADRYNPFLGCFLAYETNTQSRSLVKQTLSETLNLDAGTIELLLDGNLALGLPRGLLVSSAEPLETAIVDFLGGLVGTYYNSPAPDPAQVEKVQIDPGINLDGTQASFGSATWIGKLLAPSTAAYSFSVAVASASTGGTTSQVALTIDNETVNLVSLGTAFSSASTISLTAGQLYNISLAVSGAPPSAAVQLQWSISPNPPNTFVTIPAAAFAPCAADGSYPTLALLFRIALFIRGFSMKPAEIAYFSTHAADFAGTDPATSNSVPFSLAGLASVSDAPALFNQWQRLDALYRFKSRLPSGNASVFDIFAAASSASVAAQSPSASPSTVVQLITAATGWQQDDVLALTGPSGFNLQNADFRNEIPLLQLSSCLSTCFRIGVSAGKLLDWANPASSSLSSHEIAQDIQHTTKAKYDDATWVEVGKPLNDKLRESSKDALITYILEMPQMRGFVDGNDLYGYFLIDVEMCTCMETSRIVQASAAVQLFVQRCLLNLEDEVSPSAFTAEDLDEWNQFRCQYRVWQAAVEVLMYPENWLSPELRQDKTPFFQDLETTLLQGEINEANVEKAYLAYLESLQQVARLEISGVYNDSDPEAGTDLTYVVGRTFTTPHVYFYRTLDNSSYAWSAWQKIDADISGDTLVPVVWNRRLFLFWPIYTEVTDPSQNTPPASTLSNQNNTFSVPQSPPPIKSLQIQLAWSEYKDGKWTSKQVTHESLVPPGYASYCGTLDTSAFAFTATPGGQNQDELAVSGYARLYLPEADNLAITAFLEAAEAAMRNASSNTAAAASALQSLIVAMGQMPLVHFAANCASFTSFQKVALELSAVMQGSSNHGANFVKSTLAKAAKEFQTAYETVAIKLKGPQLVPLGSFFFDGPQGSVEINPNLAVSGPEAPNLFPAVANHYAAPKGEDVAAFSYQDISINNAGFSLLFAEPSAHKPDSLSVFDGKISGADIAFPPQALPGCTLDPSLPTGEKIAFFADRRRTYFVVQSSPSPKLLHQKDAKKAHLSESIPAESVYCFNHHHPWVGEFIKRLNWKGISYLLDPSTQALVTKFDDKTYRPSKSVAKPYPDESVDFGQVTPSLQKAKRKGAPVHSATPPGDSAYSIYNWEIFFHIPLFIATCLTRNQQFEDARRWFHYIFNPTQDPLRKDIPSGFKRGVPNGYWNFLPLNLLDKDGGLEDLLDAVNGQGSAAAELNAQVQAWTQTPFDPDAVAKLRPTAYQKAVLMKYVDNLIKWGDYLFAQNTRETIYEATQYYVLADQTWGRKPTIIPQLGIVQDKTYEDLARDGLNPLGNAQVQLEDAFPLAVVGKAPTKRATGSPLMGATTQTSYFGIPSNPTLFQYFDTIADRLYKIRHCMNIEGQVEQLPLFAAPINPGLLIAAAAAGVDLSSVLNDLAAAVPHYRFTYMLPKALELCSEVRSLGGALLSACEKYDAEGMALLRSTQEISLLEAVREIKQLQIEEANDNLQALEGTLAVTTARQSYYQGLVSGGLSAFEIAQAEFLALSEEFKLICQVSHLGASAAATVPQLDIGVNGAFGTPSVHVTYGGQQVSTAATDAGDAFTALAEVFSFVASMSGMMGGWARRSAEWAFQLETANLEVAQIQQQIKAAQVRVKIAKQDLANQELQIAHSNAVHSALRSKFTNQQLYSWMMGQVSALFFQCYQMAYDLAKRAEVCYRFELGIPQSSYIQFGYWDSLKKGLLAGEKLFKDLKRLEIAYIDQNAREYEISKNISLLLLDPFALISLKLTGSCVINLPEAYFDMDYPGHYMRRIKSVGLTIPCVTGPYTSVNCTLTLLQSKIRFDNKASSVSSYPEKPVGSDPRFCYDFAATESIATSTAQNDTGVFEVSFRDERYLPFEGFGVVSQWQLSMPPDSNAFDFETITDVILNLKYTARSGGDSMRAAARSAAILPALPVQPPSQSTTSSPAQTNLQRCFSLKHEYPTEWYKFMQPPATNGAAQVASMQINLSNERFPFQYRGRTIKITHADLFVLFGDSGTSSLQAFSLSAPNGTSSTGANSVQLSPSVSVGNAPHFSTAKPPVPAPTGQGAPNCWILQYPGDLSQLVIADMFLVCGFSAS